MKPPKRHIVLVGKTRTFVLDNLVGIIALGIVAGLIAGGTYIISQSAGKTARASGEDIASSVVAKRLVGQVKATCDSGNVVRALDQIRDGNRSQAQQDRTHRFEGIRDCAIFAAYGDVVRLPGPQERRFVREIRRSRVPVVKRGQVVKVAPLEQQTTVEYLKRCKCNPPE